MKVGILGGSFDPAHFGHVSISLQAIKRLNLNQVWWIVTEQNPLKKKAYYSVNNRCKLALFQSQQHKKIKIFSSRHNRTYDEVQHLKLKYPTYKFIWIMGIDNLLNIHKWYKWTHINDLIPFIIFDRGQIFHRVMKGRFMIRFVSRYCNIVDVSYDKQIIIICGRKLDLSSTMLRQLIR